MRHFPVLLVLLWVGTLPGWVQAGEVKLHWQVNYKQVRLDELGRQIITPDFMSLSSEVGTQFDQYDARILYPVRQQGLRLDLGLHLRYVEGYAHISAAGMDAGRMRSTLNTTIPSFYASALFDLPFQGLSAGFEGSRSGLSDYLFDYRAKLRYHWRNGFDLQGGWQHQQMNLDPELDNGPLFTRFGPYLDLHWQF